MKELFNYCVQHRKYADSYGECLVELEDGETLKNVIDKYIEEPHDWYERVYSNAKELEKYDEKLWNGKIVHHTGRLVLMKTEQAYSD